jgi:hypothetical protein
MPTPRLRLEPHAKFKSALVGKPADLRYSYWKLVDIFKSKDEMTEEDAMEWVDYNVMGLVPMGLRVKTSLSRAEAKKIK